MILSTILATSQLAVNFAVQRLQEGHDDSALFPCKATLIIVPSTRKSLSTLCSIHRLRRSEVLIENWLLEIKTYVSNLNTLARSTILIRSSHIRGGTLAVHKYHGSQKYTNTFHLLQHDIVITTYATLLYDFRHGRGPLERIEWYRIVLDEGARSCYPHGAISTNLMNILFNIAHIVRNWSTKQFRAVQALTSQVRWCLTGTPIQNSLEDLASLLRFLKVPVLEDLPCFRKYIVAPVFSRSPEKFKNLQCLLESLCLRRTKAVLDLPDPNVETVKLKFSSQEMTAYLDLVQSWRVVIDKSFSGRNAKKTNQAILQAIHKLRIFCNNGQNSLRDQDFVPIYSSDDPTKWSEDTCCSVCNEDMAALQSAGAACASVFIPCQHVICTQCRFTYLDAQESAVGAQIACPCCVNPGRLIPLSAENSNTADDGHAHFKAETSKLNQVRTDLMNQDSEDKRYFSLFD